MIGNRRITSPYCQTSSHSMALPNYAESRRVRDEDMGLHKYHNTAEECKLEHWDIKLDANQLQPNTPNRHKNLNASSSSSGQLHSSLRFSSRLARSRTQTTPSGVEQVSFIWAAHQVHHSSEYYNLTTALRQSLTQQFTSWIFYLPMALIAPPAVFAVHIQLNLLYQFWIHTELIKNLGPLEWVFNTPTHHKVHHGRNSYCIDKNYGGILIIWDRLFGTFAAEKEKVVFGLVSPINTFDILYVQVGSIRHHWCDQHLTSIPLRKRGGVREERRLNVFQLFENKQSSVLKYLQGWGWDAGEPTCGGLVTGQEVPHDPSWSLPLQMYVIIHFLLALGTYQDVFENKMTLSQFNILGMTGYVLLTLTSMGFLIDQRPRAAVLEMLRCVVMVTMQRYGYMKPLLPTLAVTTQGCLSLPAAHSPAPNPRLCGAHEELVQMRRGWYPCVRMSRGRNCSVGVNSGVVDSTQCEILSLNVQGIGPVKDAFFTIGSSSVAPRELCLVMDSGLLLLRLKRCHAAGDAANSTHSGSAARLKQKVIFRHSSVQVWWTDAVYEPEHIEGWRRGRILAQPPPPPPPPHPDSRSENEVPHDGDLFDPIVRASGEKTCSLTSEPTFYIILRPQPLTAFVSLSLLYWALQSFSQMFSIRKKTD
ncbi:hypothetical protein NQZ68_025538 [Dissostichus eleginoides]|nr:hypothetical protein NQZ68_025538 [Dissostichus eleginoides]